MGVLANSNDGNGFVETRSVVDTTKQLKILCPLFGGICGWDYFNAGLADETNDEDGTEPWKWVQKIRSALYGALSKSQNLRREK